MVRHYRLSQLATAALLITATVCSAQGQPASATQPNAGAGSPIILPAGTRIVLAVVRPIATKSANSGDLIYLQTTFPVIVGGKLAIPAGTFVQGVLAGSPNRLKRQIDLPMQPVVLIFGSGHTVTVPGASSPAAAGAVQAATVTASVNRNGDSSLLDTGSPGEIVLPVPLTLEEPRMAGALRQPRRLMAVHDLTAASRPAQNPWGTCYTPEVPPKPEVVTVGSYMIDTETLFYTTSTPAVPAKPGTPYPCP